MIELDSEQRQAIAQGQPVRIIDPVTHDAYVLVRAEEYARLAEHQSNPHSNNLIRTSRQRSSARNRRSGGTCPDCSWTDAIIGSGRRTTARSEWPSRGRRSTPIRNAFDGG